VGEPAEGYYAGLPGEIYARVLQELWTEVFPTGAYWNPTRELSDTRIPAFGEAVSAYLFEASGGEMTLSVELIFRRAAIQMMDWKAWETPDILMESETLLID
jgi:hypothetical protein